jgi:hypothetical protein
LVFRRVCGTTEDDDDDEQRMKDFLLPFVLVSSAVCGDGHGVWLCVWRLLAGGGGGGARGQAAARQAQEGGVMGVVVVMMMMITVRTMIKPANLGVWWLQDRKRESAHGSPHHMPPYVVALSR